MNTLIAETKTAPSPVAPPQPLSLGAPRRRILLVDDLAQLRELGRQVLVRSGYNVDTAEDGAEAWAALHKQDYDLLITDNQMPRLTGLELIRKVREARMTVPIILTSGTLAQFPEGDQLGGKCAALLAKPFTTEQLVSAVQNGLRARTSLRRTTGLPFNPRPNGSVNE